MNALKNKIFIANDHAGFTLKKYILETLPHFNIIDLGCHSEQPVDYPDFAQILCENIKDATSFGILICGSGIGMSIAANRYPNIRAALCHDIEYAKLAREHNNANVIALGARFLNPEDAVNMITCFLLTDFIGARHINRVNKLSLLG